MHEKVKQTYSDLLLPPDIKGVILFIRFEKNVYVLSKVDGNNVNNNK